MNWKEWTTPGASNRLTLLNGAGIALFLGYGYAAGDISLVQLQQVLLALLAYAAGMTAAVLVPYIRSDGSRQTVFLTACMITLILATTLLAEVTYPAIMLWFPALHATLRLRQRVARSVVLFCALLWLGINHYHNPADYLAWIRSVLELLPAALLLWVIRGLHREVSDTRNRVTELSYRDELTGLLNMRSFTRMLQSEHDRISASGREYALLMIDIDHLQIYNDRYGHEQGNRVIVAVAEAIKRSTRSDDLIARYGGDEFMVLLPGAGDDLAEIVSNRIAQNVYNITLSFDRSMQRVSVNIGRAVFPASGSGIKDMMSFADRAMYRDKEFRRSVNDHKKDVGQLKAQAGVEDWGQ